MGWVGDAEELLRIRKSMVERIDREISQALFAGLPGECGTWESPAQREYRDRLLELRAELREAGRHLERAGQAIEAGLADAAARASLQAAVSPFGL